MSDLWRQGSDDEEALKTRNYDHAGRCRAGGDIVGDGRHALENTSKKTRISQRGVNQSGSPSKNGREKAVRRRNPGSWMNQTTESTIDKGSKEQRMLKESDKGGHRRGKRWKEEKGKRSGPG